MNVFSIPTNCKFLPNSSRTHAFVSKAAGKVLNSTIDAELQPMHNFEAGELVLVRVSRNKASKALMLGDGEVIVPKEGDFLICMLGANGSFKRNVVKVPKSPSEELVIVGLGGLAGTPVFETDENVLVVRYVSTLVDNYKPIKLVDKLTEKFTFEKPLIAVVGTETGTGKTITASKIIAELKQLGLTVGACKLTGICGGSDPQDYLEAAADEIVDFSDAGLASTICSEGKVLEAAMKCLSSLQRNDIVVAELGSSLVGLHPVMSILRLFNSDKLKVVVCCADVPGAFGAIFLLGEIGVRPSLFSGLVSNSRLACDIVLKKSGIPCVPPSKQLISVLLSEGVKNELC